MTLTALLNEYGIKHFTEKELSNASSKIPAELYENIIPTLLVADRMRSELEFKIKINSAYRDEEKNRLVGGSSNSMHKKFNALDIKPLDEDPEKLSQMKNWLKNFDFLYFKTEIVDGSKMGIGEKYKTFLHIDTRGILGKHSPARW